MHIYFLIRPCAPSKSLAPSDLCRKATTCRLMKRRKLAKNRPLTGIKFRVFQTVVRVLTGQCCFAPTMLDSSYPTSNRGGSLWIAQDSKRKLARQSDRVCDCCVLGTCISLHAPRFGSILSVFKIHVDLAPVMI
jgi:hypothetical protein